MLFHTSFVLRALLGRSVSWDAQPRGDRGISWREALMRHKWHLVLGLVWGGAILVVAPKFIWWMMPVIAGMLIAVPFTVLTSRASLGRALRQHGWLLTPEETAPPPELAALEAMHSAEESPRATALAASEPAPAPERLVRVPQPAPLAMAVPSESRAELRPRAA
jgi:membrane glycosyltransferase